MAPWAPGHHSDARPLFRTASVAGPLRHDAQSAPPHRRAHSGQHAGAVQPLWRAQRLHHHDLGRAEHQPGQPVLPLSVQGRVGQHLVRPVREPAVRAAGRQHRRAGRGGCVVLPAFAVRADLAVPLSVPRRRPPAVAQPAAGDALSRHPAAQARRAAPVARHPAGQARRLRRRRPPARRRGRQHGGAADLLAELRIRAAAAQRHGARERAGRPAARRLPRDGPAGAAPGRGVARAPHGADRGL